MSAAPALAATTWTVSPGGQVSAKAGTTTFTDTTTGSKIPCLKSKKVIIYETGSGLPGEGLASVNGVRFIYCTGPLGLAFTVTPNDLPWKFNAVSYDSSTGVTTGTITGIDATVSATSCSADVDGTAADSHTGKVKVKYTNSTGKLKVLATGGNLHLYNVSGCASLINSGDAITLSATYKVSPAQTITSP